MKAAQAQKARQSAIPKGENVKVAVRLRPMNRLEKRTNQKETWVTHENNIMQVWQHPKGGMGKDKDLLVYPFDFVFGPETSTETVYQVLALPVIESVMDGYHGCVFAYGQTSSGKTHTIHGSSKFPGVIPQAISDMFDIIEASDREFVLRVSYMEIYNEIVNDLLAPENSGLRIREDARLGVFVEGLKEDVVMSADQIFSLLHAGESHRHVGRTNYNDVSSRSHTIFRIVVESSPLGQSKGGVRTSAINIVDLAGSENAVKAGSEERLKETGYINKSLLTLGHVIFKLAENKNDHIPFRDSKLTRILQSSLSGRAKVAVCCCVSPASSNLEESISTLKFANRAKNIKTSSKLNEKMDGATLLRKYREQISELEAKLEEQKIVSEQLVAEQKEKEATRRQLRQREQEKAELEAQIANFKRLILTSSAAPALSDGLPDPSKASTIPLMSKDQQVHSRRPPEFMRGRSQSHFMTMPAKAFRTLMKEHKGFAPLKRRPSLSKEDDDPDDDLSCETPSSRTDSTAAEEEEDAKIEDVVELRKRLSQVRQKLKKSNALLDAQDEEIKALKREVKDKDDVLKDYDTYFVQSENKMGAIRAEVQRVASGSSGKDAVGKADLNELFSTLDIEDTWDAPLVDYHAPPVNKGRSQTTIVGPSTGGKSFGGVLEKWKAKEQD